MDEPVLVVISLTMFVGSYIAGCIPLFFTLNERRIRIASIFGAGLLVGTALCVIIPEGVSTLIDSSQQPHQHHNGVLPCIENMPIKNDVAKPIIQLESKEQVHRLEERRKESMHFDEHKKYVEGSVEPKNELSAEETGGKGHRRRRSVKREAGKEPAVENRTAEAAALNVDTAIGVYLLVGFLFMFIVDQLAKMSHNRNNKSLSTLGLVIHAFADGIAMGSASSAGSQWEMQILVFVAIMLHKAPAAFALVSILLAQGLEKSRIRRHLLVFSLAAPIGTILTYTFLLTTQATNSIPSDGSSPEAAPSHFTGAILLFSAGTFLYIATVHVLPELIESNCGNSTYGHEGMTGSRELLLGGHASGLAGPISRLSLFEICLFCASALIPAFISSSSSHGHGH